VGVGETNGKLVYHGRAGQTGMRWKHDKRKTWAPGWTGRAETIGKPQGGKVRGERTGRTKKSKKGIGKTRENNNEVGGGDTVGRTLFVLSMNHVKRKSLWLRHVSSKKNRRKHGVVISGPVWPRQRRNLLPSKRRRKEQNSRR